MEWNILTNPVVYKMILRCGSPLKYGQRCLFQQATNYA